LACLGFHVFNCELRSVYMPTHENPGEPRTSWAVVYATELTIGVTQRLTLHGIADFSLTVSPSYVYIVVASYRERGWCGEVEELNTDIYIFLTRDGTNWVKVVEHGGWPSWVDESTLYFHRRSVEDNWISVYKATLPNHGPISIEPVIVERVTPPGLHAFTPAASPGNKKFIAVATRRWRARQLPNKIRSGLSRVYPGRLGSRSTRRVDRVSPG